MAREDEIRLIAYNIWQEEGCVHGPDCEQWLRAEIIWSGRENEKALAKSVGAKSKQQIKARATSKKAK